MRVLDRWREILEVLWRRKLRTLLTALSVAWGIFMLVVLLAAGKGLSNGVEKEFASDSVNAVRANPWRTSKPHAGNPVGRRIRMTMEDHELVRDTLAAAENVTARINLPGEITVRVADRHAGFQIRAVHPEHQQIEKSTIIAGRFLNPADVAERRKVAVIGVKVRATLFPHGEEALARLIQIGSGNYTVIGVFEEENEEDEDQTIYIPITTAQLVYGNEGRIDRVMFTIEPSRARDSGAVVEELRRMLAARHGFAPDDKQAVWIWNSQEMWTRIMGLFLGIRVFVWVIGLGTILAGVVGVSNIMLISVQERIREIGIRKAVGAKPMSIVTMIVEEAVLMTLVSGYAGLVAAVALIEAVSRTLPPTDFFRNPEVDIGVGMAATLVLVVAGVVAGLFPAVRAARINPITALRVE